MAVIDQLQNFKFFQQQTFIIKTKFFVRKITRFYALDKVKHKEMYFDVLNNCVLGNVCHRK